MSDPIGMTIEIGGNLPDSKVEELMKHVLDEIGDLNEGPTTAEEFRAEAGDVIKWTGVSNYGLCEKTIKFLKANKIGFIHRADAKYEYDAMTTFWLPGMKFEKAMNSDSNGNTMVHAEEIRPLCHMLLTLAEQGTNALPLFIRENLDEDMTDLVERCLKTPEKALGYIREEVEKMLPIVPKLPALILI